MNNTKVFCTVYGPRQTALRQFNEQANLNCTFKYTTFAEGLYKRRRFVAVRTLWEVFSLSVCGSLSNSFSLSLSPSISLSMHLEYTFTQPLMHILNTVAWIVIATFYFSLTNAHDAPFLCMETSLSVSLARLLTHCRAPSSGCSSTQDEEETDVCTQLQQALAVAVQLGRYPKSAIDVCILCVESDGNPLGYLLLVLFFAFVVSF
jgi:ribonuclease PH